MSFNADERLQKLDEVLQCLPHELVRLVRDYDLRRRHRFYVEPFLDSKSITLSQDQTEFHLMEHRGFVAMRGECSFASAALQWSIKVPLGLRAWIGIVLLNSTHEKDSFDFENKDICNFVIFADGTASANTRWGGLRLSDGDTLAYKPRTLAPYTIFTFAVDLDTQTLRIARNGIWSVDSFRTNLPNLAEATVYACLIFPGSLTLESADE